MLTDAQTDILVNMLHERVVAAGWPEHTAENSRRWLQRGAVVAHVGPNVIALRTWTGAILRESRNSNSAEGTRLANEEFRGLEGEPVVDEAARLIAQTGDGHDDESVFQSTSACPEHGKDRTIGCQSCGLPVIERIVFCGCPTPPRGFGSGASFRYNIRFLTGQLNHVKECPGFQSEPIVAPVVAAQATEVVRPKRKPAKREVVSLALDLSKP